LISNVHSVWFVTHNCMFSMTVWALMFNQLSQRILQLEGLHKSVFSLFISKENSYIYHGAMVFPFTDYHLKIILLITRNTIQSVKLANSLKTKNDKFHFRFFSNYYECFFENHTDFLWFFSSKAFEGKFAHV
jgi:hypothetical protein